MAPKPARQTYVRQTGDGIRVSPAALNKKKLACRSASRAFLMTLVIAMSDVG